MCFRVPVTRHGRQGGIGCASPDLDTERNEEQDHGDGRGECALADAG
jgi:hypothetical protein